MPSPLTLRYVYAYIQCSFPVVTQLCHSVPGKCPLPGKCPCTSFQGVNVAASIQNYVLGKRPCGPKS